MNDDMDKKIKANLGNAVYTHEEMVEAMEMGVSIVKDVITKAEERKRKAGSPRKGSTFDSFLEEEGIAEEVKAEAARRVKDMTVTWRVHLQMTEDFSASLDSCYWETTDNPPDYISRNGLKFHLMDYKSAGGKGEAHYIICSGVNDEPYTDWSEICGEAAVEQDWILGLFGSATPGEPPLDACIFRGMHPPGCIERERVRYRIYRSETMLSGPGHATYVQTRIQDGSYMDWRKLSIPENESEADKDEVVFFSCVIGGRCLHSNLINELRGAWTLGVLHARGTGAEEEVQLYSDWSLYLYDKKPFHRAIAHTNLINCEHPPPRITRDGQRFRLVDERNNHGIGTAWYMIEEGGKAYGPYEDWDELGSSSKEGQLGTLIGDLSEMSRRGQLVFARTGQRKDEDLWERVKDRLNEQVFLEDGTREKGHCVHHRIQGTIDPSRHNQVVKCSDCGEILRFIRREA